MRSAVAFLVLLLLAAAAAAQVTVSDEVVSTPLQLRLVPLSIAAPAVSLAKDNAGVAVAWTTAVGPASNQLLDRIYVARLDAGGHVAGVVRELPVAATKPSHAAYPSLAAAPGGNGFVLAWLEIDSGNPALKQAVSARLDGALVPSMPVTLSPVAADVALPPVVRTKGGTTWIAAGGLWTLDANGSLTGPIYGVTASDMTVATDVPQYVGAQSTRSATYTHCSAEPGCVIGHFPGLSYCIPACQLFTSTYSLGFTSLLTTSQGRSYSFNSDAQPAIGSNGSDVLVAWFNGDQASGGDLVAVRLAPGDFASFADAAGHPTHLAQFPPDAGPTRPSIASDGQHYVVVWRSRTALANHDIDGMVIDADGKLTPFSIATSGADEADPAVLYVGGGRFLVAYDKMTAVERRIAGRFVTLGASGRPRPAR